jgi:hypothetical protein
MLATRSVFCPYCGERFETALDCSAGDQEYIEDCQVCCRPIVFALATDDDGGLLTLEVRREDD